MGLLGRKRSLAQEITPEQVEGAVSGLIAWEKAASFSEFNSVATQLANLGSWHWWLDLAKRAKENSDGRLVGQITCFATQSTAVLGAVPGLGPLPSDVHRALDDLTIESLGGAPPRLVVQDGGGGLIDAETLVGWARTRRQANAYSSASSRASTAGDGSLGLDHQLAKSLSVAVRVFELSRGAVLAETQQAPEIGQDDPIEEDPGSDVSSAEDVPGTDGAPAEEAVGRSRFAALKEVGKGALDQAVVAKEKAAPLAHRAQSVVESDRVQGLVSSARERSQPLTAAAFGVVRGRVYPGHPEWARASLADRADWWSRRLGTVAAATTAVPGFAGRGTKVDKLVPLFGATGQVLVVFAVCEEAGIDDTARMTQLASSVVFKRELPTEAVGSALSIDPAALPGVDIDSDGVDPPSAKSGGSVSKAIEQIRVIRQVGRSLNEVEELLDKRHRGGWFVRKATGVVGLGSLATFQSERVGIRKAAMEAVKLVEQYS